ncbi:MAG TPA: hypothetical protein VNN74_07315 [Candidatus Micrarchaeia archaeon]|nr:hypothetical protein [Candidatus Micrarchaeia archaeon]
MVDPAASVDPAAEAPDGVAGARPGLPAGWRPRLEASERWLLVGMFVVAGLAFLVVVVMLGVAGD